MNGHRNNAPRVIIWTLFLLFTTLRLTHQINWSWWWITAPLWLSLLIAVILGVTVRLLHQHFMRTDPGYRVRHVIRELLNSLDRDARRPR